MPYWHVCAVGPEQTHLRFTQILRKTREEAEEFVWSVLDTVNEKLDCGWERDDWRILHAVIVNGN